MFRTLYWQKNSLFILNQKLLPHRVVYRRCTSYRHVAECIKDMIIRGAPAIGVAAAYGMVFACKKTNSLPVLKRNFYKAKRTLAKTRPTAVNLFWALENMERLFLKIARTSPDIQNQMLACAHALYKKDIASNKKIGLYGARLLKRKSVVLTHCNAGALATAGWGTALGVIRTAYKQEKIKKVFVDETRPYLQGARLTAWELKKEKIPAELITDNMAGHMMKTETVNAVIVGADRIAANGDAANKIGTYSLAILARYHQVPFYVAAPASTFDMRITSGSCIPIEERSRKEVTCIGGVNVAPRNMAARHPAFDVTPAGLISAIITDRGVIHKPNKQKIKKLFKNNNK